MVLLFREQCTGLTQSQRGAEALLLAHMSRVSAELGVRGRDAGTVTQALLTLQISRERAGPLGPLITGQVLEGRC